MEALVGLEHKYTYEIVGHSGATDRLVLVEMGRPPANRAGRLAVVRAIVDHAASCVSGDNTLSASMRAIRQITDEVCLCVMGECGDCHMRRDVPLHLTSCAA